MRVYRPTKVDVKVCEAASDGHEAILLHFRVFHLPHVIRAINVEKALRDRGVL